MRSESISSVVPLSGITIGSFNSKSLDEDLIDRKEKTESGSSLRRNVSMTFLILVKLVEWFVCVTCCGCPRIIVERCKKRLKMLTHKLHHYEIFKSLPFVIIIIFMFLDLPFFLKNAIYYGIKGELSLPKTILDGTVRVFSVPLSFICYYITYFLIRIYKKTNRTWIGCLSMVSLLLTVLGIISRIGFHQSFSSKAFFFDPDDPFTRFDLIPITLSVMLIQPLSGLGSILMMITPIFIHSFRNILVLNRHVRSISMIVTVWFTKKFEDRLFYKDEEYVQNLRKMQKRVISEKQKCLETLQMIVPIRLLPHFQNSGKGRILLEHVYVVSAKISKFHFRYQSKIANLVPRERTLFFYRLYLKCSDMFEKVCKKFNMFRLQEEKERMAFMTYSQKLSEKEIISVFFATLKMKDKYLKNHKINTSFEIKFFVCYGPMSMGIDTTNESKIRFLVASPGMITGHEKMEKHPDSHTGDIYSILGQFKALNKTFLIEQLPTYFEGEDHMGDFVKISRVLGLRRGSIESVDRDDEDSSSECSESDFGEGNLIEEEFLVPEKEKNEKNKKEKEEKKKKKKEKENNDLLMDVKWETDGDKEVKEFFSEKGTSFCISLFFFCGRRAFKNKALEKMYRKWAKGRDLDSTRMIFNVFVGFLIKILIVISIQLNVVEDEVYESEFPIVSMVGQVPILILILIVLGKVYHRNGKNSSFLFYLLFFLDSLYSYCWLLFLWRNGSITDMDISYIDIDFYFSTFLIFQSHPYIPLLAQTFFSFSKFIIWFYLRIHLMLSRRFVFVFFFILGSLHATLVIFVAYYKRLARMRASRTLFKYSFQVKKMINFLLKSRAVNRVIIMNSLPMHLKIKKFLTDDHNSNKLKNTECKDDEFFVSNAEEEEERQEEEDNLLFLGNCIVMVLRLEWIFDKEEKCEKGGVFVENMLGCLASLNESLERIIDNSKVKTGMERLLFTEKCCIVVHYNEKDFSELFSLSLKIKKEIEINHPRVHSRICLFHDKKPSIGCFGKERSHVGLFSDMYLNCLDVLDQTSMSYVFRNRILVLMKKKMYEESDVGEKFKLKEVIMRGKEIFEVLGKKKVDDEDEDEEEEEEEFGRNQRKEGRRYFNLMIDRYLPHDQEQSGL